MYIPHASDEKISDSHTYAGVCVFKMPVDFCFILVLQHNYHLELTTTTAPRGNIQMCMHLSSKLKAAQNTQQVSLLKLIWNKTAECFTIGKRTL